MRLIDADDFFRQFEELDIEPYNNVSTIEERPKGEWIEVDVRNCHATLKCSVCDRVIEPTFNFGEYSYEDIKTFYPYCHCGADMR